MVQQATALPIVRDVWIPMSYEEWLDWVPAGNLGEWVDGKGIIFVSASENHQLTVVLIFNLIARFAALHTLGKAMLAPYHIRLWEGGPAREPDALFVANEHLDRWTSTRVNGAVDFALEVISPDSVVRDREEKWRQYAEAGIPEYLMIDPRPARYWFGLYRLADSGQYEPVEPDSQGRYHLQTIPGFWLESRWFLQVPLPDAEALLLEIAGDVYRDWMLAKFQRR